MPRAVCEENGTENPLNIFHKGVLLLRRNLRIKTACEHPDPVTHTVRVIVKRCRTDKQRRERHLKTILLQERAVRRNTGKIPGVRIFLGMAIDGVQSDVKGAEEFFYIALSTEFRHQAATRLEQFKKVLPALPHESVLRVIQPGMPLFGNWPFL